MPYNVFMLTVNKYMNKTETRVPVQTKEGYDMKERINEFICNLFEFQNRDLNIRQVVTTCTCIT